MYAGAVSLYSWLILVLLGESVAIIAQAYFLASAITQLFDGAGFEAVITDIIFFLGSFALRYILQHTAAHLSERHALETARHDRESLFQTYFYQQTHLHNGTEHLMYYI